MTLSFLSGLGRVGDWVFRRAAMREARARLVQPTPVQERALDQATMLVEVARRVAEPVEALPKGSRPAVLASLYRDAVYWALRACARASDQKDQDDQQGDSDPPGLAAVWAGASPETLLKAAGDEATLASVRNLLVDQSIPAALTATDEDIARARTFSEALLWELDASNRVVERVHVQRWTRVSLVLVVCVVAVLGMRALLRGPNLASAKLFKTSSSFPDCTAPNKCADLLFHTQPQESPWAVFDLGSVKTVRRVEVTNRSDCCADRAIPLIVEVSVDDKRWVQVARRDTAFAQWNADFPKQRARYVKFRVPRNSVLNLDDVVIR